MINRSTLLAAVAAIALPAAIAGAQTPLTATQSHPARHASRPTPPPAQHPATPTANTATEDAQDAAAPTTAPEPVNENAEPGTPTEVTTQAQTATPVPTPAEQAAPTSAPADAHAQTQLPAATTPPTSEQQPTPAPTEAQAQAQPGATVVATAADVRAGVQVRDQTGGMVGTIESVDASGAVVATGTARAKLPLTSFGRNDQGLVISLTRAQLEAAAQQAQPAPTPTSS